MRFKAPKGDIFGWSIFWLVCGVFLSIYGPLKGETTLSVLGILFTISAMLIWFDQKWIAPLLMIFYGLGGVGRLVSIFTKGITLYAVVRVLMPFYFIYILWEWYRSDHETLALVTNPSTRSPTSPFDTPQADDHLSNPYRESHLDER